MTRALIIDPPVTPFSSAGELRAWIGRLTEIRKSVAGNPTSVELVDQELERAREWLRDRADPGSTLDPDRPR